jgi:DNA modification methylase
MKPYFQHGLVTIYCGDCLDVLPQLDNASAIVTDPSYELGFMGKSWDSTGVSFQPETWKAVRNACKSGAMLLSFGGTRTFHRIAVAIEDAGWEIRDTVMWVYGSGFPKSLDISKAIDKQAGIWRGKSGGVLSTNRSMAAPNYERADKGMPILPEAQLWSGYGTALKPAYEPIIVAMNPLDGTFARNALEHGVAGINIDECRIGSTKDTPASPSQHNDTRCHGKYRAEDGTASGFNPNIGRFPANIIHDGSPEVMELFPDTKSGKPGIKHKGNDGAAYGAESRPAGSQMGGFGDSGSAARFFYNTGTGEDYPARFKYCAKASKSERGSHNTHPTVKPISLMKYLCTLVRYPEHNLIIDPFMGSGSTLLACMSLGIPCIGIEKDEDSCVIAAVRCLSQREGEE